MLSSSLITLVLIWLVSLVSAEASGLLVYRLMSRRNSGLSTARVLPILDTVIVSLRLATLYIILAYTGFDLVELFGLGTWCLAGIALSSLGLIVVALFDAYFSGYRRGEPWEFQLMDYRLYKKNRIQRFCFLRVLYYFSEITIVNTLYLLGNEAIKLPCPLLTGGLIAVLVGWALLHVFTKDLNTVLDVTMYSLVAFTVAYYTGSMVYPIIAWFLILII
ncbi:MAG: hypothetical protein GSR76_00015 [Desulfurococcales archaeon]|nr:hypothetical protein [Desulfurococcales archaeon]